MIAIKQLTLTIFCFSVSFGEVVDVQNLHVASYISYRFATTYVTSTLRNEFPVAKEVIYEVQLPDAAFIANFSMLIDDVIYPSSIKKKDEAKKEYDQAVERGETAGHVVAKSRHANTFSISISVASNESVTFYLTYQELLKRRLGVYEHVIYIDPGQTVNDMVIEVFILESRKITFIHVPPIRTDLLSDRTTIEMNTLAEIARPQPNSAYIRYAPTVQQQITERQGGILGQFVVHYDVERDSSAGQLLVINGYFVHYIAPKNLSPLPRDVLFVLDVSGSMDGRKLVQMKQAMLEILSDLTSKDRFNVAAFSSTVTFWNNNYLDANADNIYRAKSKVEELKADGGTNMYDGLVDGIQFCNSYYISDRVSMLLFLTDGQPTAGETNHDKIVDDTTRRNEDVTALFGLAFGQGAHYELIKRVASRNRGLARRIYDESDASLQLKGFFDEISTPLLSDIEIKYVGDTVDQTSLTVTTFPNYFDGTEIVVAGSLMSNRDASIYTTVTGTRVGGKFSEAITVSSQKSLTSQEIAFGEDITQFSERLWVFLTIKQLLIQLDRTDNEVEISSTEERITHLALKYGLVTPYTSLVVTKPLNDTSGGSSRGLNSNRELDGSVMMSAPGGAPAVSHKCRVTVYIFVFLAFNAISWITY